MTGLSLTDRVQCMRMSRIEMGLDYDIINLLSCYLVSYYFPQLRKVVVVLGPDMVQQS